MSESEKRASVISPLCDSEERTEKVSSPNPLVLCNTAVLKWTHSSQRKPKMERTRWDASWSKIWQTNVRRDCCKVLKCTKHRHPQRSLCFYPALGGEATTAYWTTQDGLRLEQLKQPFMFSLNFIHIQQQLQRHAYLLKKYILNQNQFLLS